MKIEKLIVWGVLIAVAYYIVKSMRKDNGNGSSEGGTMLIESPDQEGLPESKRMIVVGAAGEGYTTYKCCSRDGREWYKTARVGARNVCGDNAAVCGKS